MKLEIDVYLPVEVVRDAAQNELRGVDYVVEEWDVEKYGLLASGAEFVRIASNWIPIKLLGAFVMSLLKRDPTPAITVRFQDDRVMELAVKNADDLPKLANFLNRVGLTGLQSEFDAPCPPLLESDETKSTDDHDECK